MTSHQRLSEGLFVQLAGQPLADYVIAKRAARPRWSWKLIAEELAADTGGQVVLSHEALRQWYGDHVPAAVAS
jgi:hypothetical protein